MFSIISVVLNGAEHLETCLESVACQRDVLVEHIVIDGGSTDGSVDILRQWSNRLAFWCSEPDDGISAAMNKGVIHAKGDWIIFVHADDYLTGPNILAQVRGALDERCDIAAFPVLFGSPPQLQLLQPRKAGILLNLKMGMCHQGMATRRALFDRIGLFDGSYRIGMDYDFLLRAYRCETRIKTCSAPVLSTMRDTGISSQRGWPVLQRRLSEERRIHFQHTSNALQRLGYSVYWHVYLMYRRWLSSLRK
ncbi:hypothetical protein N800_03640 [Lysobacter daejeonensis GH1-9]|uniref:Glycosyltransferase 2-like domain-containing protein n=2 Tax=Aerolutibacter TaxID=3382701 RepID=A0A0A0ESG9_9GAMM|nr:hypothetical protein N800_03640 [Lysobacter daejeonensis GH1-9]